MSAGCTLHFCGELLSSYDVDCGILIPCRRYMRGEPRRIGSVASRQAYATSGLVVDVSMRETLSGQVEESIRFLEVHRSDVARIRALPTVEAAYLDFSSESRIGEQNAAVQVEFFPAELVAIAGELRLGIMLSVYPGE